MERMGATDKLGKISSEDIHIYMARMRDRDTWEDNTKRGAM